MLHRTLLPGITRDMPAGPGKITCAHQARLVMGKLRAFCIPNEDVENPD
jgi:hypothetical protein